MGYYDTELDGYLDQLAPEAPAKMTSYMPQVATNPKASSVVSYLDTVGGAAPAESAPAPEVYSPPAAAAAPAAPAVSAPAAGSSSAVSNTYEYTTHIRTQMLRLNKH